MEVDEASGQCFAGPSDSLNLYSYGKPSPRNALQPTQSLCSALTGLNRDICSEYAEDSSKMYMLQAYAGRCISSAEHVMQACT